jgi:predicted phage terminase large subunit-like protein
MKILGNKRMLSLARKDFGLYAVATYPKFETPAHIALLVEKLEAVEAGKIKRLMISMPPRHGKTLTTSRLFPAWYLGRDPSRSVAICTYGTALAEDLGRKVQQTVTDGVHLQIFPESKLSTAVGSAERLEFERGGQFFAVSRSGTLTGRGADLILIDDLLKDSDEARSAAVRRTIRDFYERVAVTRLTPNGAIVLVGTRWGKGDLFDYLLDEKGEKQWDVVNLAAIAESGDVLGRSEGEALWPQKYGLKDLQHKRYEMGTSAFTCLYQGRPAESDGIIFKREWFRTYTQLPKVKRVIASLDSAFKTGLGNDYSALQVWGEGETGFYLLANWKQRVTFPDLKRTLVSFAEQWKPEVILIEDAASGQSLIQELRESTSLPIKAIKVDRDKESRAQSCTGMLEAGRVFLPADAPWLGDFLDELAGFPQMPHDDQVDAATMALNFLRGDTAELGVVAWLKNIKAGIYDALGRGKPSSEPVKVLDPAMAVPASCSYCGAGAESLEPRTLGVNGKARCAKCGRYTDLVRERDRPTNAPPLLQEQRTFGTTEKPATDRGTKPPACPACKSPATAYCSGRARCTQCGYMWDVVPVPEVNHGSNRTDWLSKH